MHHKIAQLILTPKKRTDTVSQVFVAQPDVNKEALAGKLFILIEIKSKRSDGLKIINFLVDTLNNNYYQNEKILLREKITTLKVEHIFESALAKSNKSLVEFLRTERLKLIPSVINITVGIIYKNYLHFTNIGNNKALLIYPAPKHQNNKNIKTQDDSLWRGVYKNKNEADKNEYKIINVSQQSEDSLPIKQPSLTKLFTNVISGTLPRGGYFIFTNETLPEYISSTQLIDIITTLPPTSATEQIKNILNKINAYVPFLGIIIKSTTGVEKVDLAQNVITSSTQSSLDTLNVTTETTEKLLTPSGIIRSKKLFLLPNILSAGLKSRLTNKIKIDGDYSGLKDKILMKKQVGRFSFTKLVQLIKNFTVYTIKLTAHIFKKREKIKPSESLISEQTQPIKSNRLLAKKFKFSNNWFKKLSKKNKALIIAVIIILLLLLQNLFVLNLKNKKIEQQQNYTELTQLIEQKQNQVDASLLYNNENDAKKYLDEIKELLAQLPQENEEQINIFNQLTEKYEEKLEKIRHIIKIESANELTNFTNLNSNAEPTNLVLVKEKNKLYLADSTQNSIYIFDLSENLALAITDLKLDIEQLVYPAIDNNNIYYFNKNNIIELNTETEAINQLAINLAEQAEIISMSSFNNRLYLLDKQNNQIYRYNKSETGFSDASNWLNENVDFSYAIDMFIDGSIYVLFNDGQLTEYFMGIKQKFELQLDSVAPIIEHPTKVMVSIEQKYIYILEPSQQRLIIFDKKGQFLYQYQFEQFTNLLDFAVDEVNKVVYFLNNTSLYQVEGKHFD